MHVEVYFTWMIHRYPSMDPAKSARSATAATAGQREVVSS